MSPRITSQRMEQADEQLQGQLGRFIEILNGAEAWADQCSGQFPNGLLVGASIREIRRRAKRAHRAISRRLCIGFFGAFQVGKSFLIAELGRGRDPKLRIADPSGRNRAIEFLSHVNPNRKDEATGVVCRFTASPQVVPQKPGMFVAKIMSHEDILKALATGVAMECNFRGTQTFGDSINGLFTRLSRPGLRDPFLDTLDEICTYMLRSFPNNPYFAELFSTHNVKGRLEQVGGQLQEKDKVELASLLWGTAGHMPAVSRLYQHLSEVKRRIGDTEYVEIPQEAVVSSDGEQATIVDSSILDGLMASPSPDLVPVTVPGGRTVCIPRAAVSALVAELCLPVERGVQGNETDVLSRADILDFPGARAGRAGAKTGFSSEHLADSESGIKNVVNLFKRGKLTHLFDGYCQEREINVLTFCFASDKPPECAHLPGQIQRWIDTRYPGYPNLGEEERKEPSLLVCVTKFDLLLAPTKGVGQRQQWDTLIDKLGKFTCGQNWKGEGWLSHWGDTEPRPFNNIFWVQDPAHRREREPHEEHSDNYHKAELIKKYVRDWESKWQEVSHPEGTGASALTTALISKLKPEIKRRELQDELNAMCKELGQLLENYYKPVENKGRVEGAEKDAACFLNLLRDARYPFGPLLDELGLPGDVVDGRIKAACESPMTSSLEDQVAEFVGALTNEWLNLTRGRIERDEWKLFDVKDPDTSRPVERFVGELAGRAKKGAFAEELASSIRFFFQHPLGITYFRRPLSVVCCRKWSDLVTTLGKPMVAAEGPALPPALTGDVPWRRFVAHWEQHLRGMYSENCSDAPEIPQGNDELGRILTDLRKLGA